MPTKDNIVTLMSLKYTNKQNYTMTVIMVLIPSFLGFIYPNVTEWLGMIGAFTGVFLAWTLPGLTYYKMYKEEKAHRIPLIFISVFTGFITVFGVACAFVCVLYALGLVHGA